MHDNPIQQLPAGNARSNLRHDFLASLVVFMVALPLCIAIAQACNLPAEVGIITGIIGGLVVGPLAGSPLQVSGPAAGLIVLVSRLLPEKETFAVGEMAHVKFI